MTDDPRSDGATPGVFDDDRLLTVALGFEDDPELLAAAAGDDVLRRRLDVLRGEVAGIAGQVCAAVPAADEDYTDPADPRWSGLHEFFAVKAPRPTRTRGRASRRLRVLAPAAAVVVLAVAVGLVAVNRDGGPVSVNGSVPSQAAEAAAPTVSGRAADGAASFADQVDQFAIVVLARARAAQGAVQRFAVVRVLKGTAPEVLRLRIADGAAATGKLHLLLLRPLAGVSSEALEASGPSSTKSGLDAYGAGKPIAYSYHGALAMARELPPGTDPDAVTLP